MEISIPNDLILTPEADELPLDWNCIPSVSTSQKYGTDILKSGTVCFAVPSVVDPGSMNNVINPIAEVLSSRNSKLIRWNCTRGLSSDLPKFILMCGQKISFSNQLV